MQKQHKSDIMAAVHETAEGLHTASVLPTRMLREFDALCLTPGQTLSAPEVENRRRELENDTHE